MAGHRLFRFTSPCYRHVRSTSGAQVRSNEFAWRSHKRSGTQTFRTVISLGDPSILTFCASHRWLSSYQIRRTGRAFIQLRP